MVPAFYRNLIEEVELSKEDLLISSINLLMNGQGALICRSIVTFFEIKIKKSEE